VKKRRFAATRRTVSTVGTRRSVVYAKNDHLLYALSENEVVRNAAGGGVFVPYPWKDPTFDAKAKPEIAH
jgi:hypothetical protein